MIYGVGATYEDGSVDHFSSFIAQGIICVGWDKKTAPAFHAMLAGMSVGDTVFIKSFSPKVGLYIKAIGIIADSDVFESNLGSARKVKWLFSANSKEQWLKFGRMYDKYDFMRGGTLYPEFNPEIVRVITDKLVIGKSMKSNEIITIEKAPRECLVRAGVIKECEIHGFDYIINEDKLQEAYKIASAFVRDGVVECAQRTLTDRIRDLFDTMPEFCHDCAKEAD